MTPVDSSADASCLHRSVTDCVLLYSSPALNLLKKEAGSDKIRIMTAASIATDCLVCTLCETMLLTDEKRILPMVAQTIKKASAYSVVICPPRSTFP